MKNKKIKTILEYSFGCIASSALYAIAIKCFIQLDGVNMISNGLSGIVLIISRLLGKVFLNPDLLYSIFYFLFNIPLLILAYKKIGKYYTLVSTINIILMSVLNLIIPKEAFAFMNLDSQADRLIIAVCAGVLAGISSGIALKMGSSTGGIDIAITYFGIKRNKQVGGFNFILNAIIIITAGFCFGEWGAMLYTIVFIFVDSQLIDVIYRRTKKRLIKVITNKKDEIATALINMSKHGVTIYECEGAYSKTHKYELQTIVLETEVNNIIATIESIDENSFISVLNVYITEGKYTMPEFK